MPLNPFDWTGTPFLILYAALFAAALAASAILPARRLPAGRERLVTDPDELAFLGGGAARVAESIAARLLVGGDLAVQDKSRLYVAPGRAKIALPGVAGAAAFSGELSWNDLQIGARVQARAVETRLRAQGLVIDADTQGTRRELALWPFGALAAFGLLKLVVGLSRDRPVGFLLCFLLATGLVALMRGTTLSPLTAGGATTLAHARQRGTRLRRAPAPGEEALAVALFGTVVLAGSAYAPLHQLRTAGGDTSGSDGGSGCGGGGGGGGGGGCGGCGP